MSDAHLPKDIVPSEPVQVPGSHRKVGIVQSWWAWNLVRRDRENKTIYFAFKVLTGDEYAAKSLSRRKPTTAYLIGYPFAAFVLPLAAVIYFLAHLGVHLDRAIKYFLYGERDGI